MTVKAHPYKNDGLEGDIVTQLHSQSAPPCIDGYARANRHKSSSVGRITRLGHWRLDGDEDIQRLETRKEAWSWSTWEPLTAQPSRGPIPAARMAPEDELPLEEQP